MSNEFGVGASVSPQDANEAIKDLNSRRTLMALPLNLDTPTDPEFFKLHSDPDDPDSFDPGPETLEAVFKKYQPKIEVELKTLDGDSVYEEIQFKSLADFGKTGITNQSETLKDLFAQKEFFEKIQSKFKTDKRLQTVLGNPELKAALLDSLSLLIDELDS